MTDLTLESLEAAIKKMGELCEESGKMMNISPRYWVCKAENYELFKNAIYGKKD